MLKDNMYRFRSERIFMIFLGIMNKVVMGGV